MSEYFEFNGKRFVPESPELRYVGWRLKHRAEGGPQHLYGYPAVCPSVDATPIEFNSGMQWLSYNINSFNTLFTPTRWTNVYDTGVAFTNNQGFGESPNRRNYVMGTNLNNEYPKLMKAIIMCGSFYRGEVVGNNLVCKPGIHAINASGAMPTVEEVLSKGWFFHAVEADTSVVTNFGQGQGQKVLVPYFLRAEVSYPLRYFQRWESNELPDYKRIYNPI